MCKMSPSVYFSSGVSCFFLGSLCFVTRALFVFAEKESAAAERRSLVEVVPDCPGATSRSPPAGGPQNEGRTSRPQFLALTAYLVQHNNPKQ